MAITLASNFDVNAQLPIDSRFKVTDLTARDALASGVRWEGMTVYVVADTKTYQLQGGITNGDWEEYGAGGGGAPVVADALSLTAGANLTITAETSQAYRVSGTGGQVTLSTTPFGTSAPIVDTYITLIGTDDTNPVELVLNNAANGCVGFGDSYILYKYSVIQFLYTISDARYICVSRT